MISEENCIYYENTEYVVFPLNTVEHWENFRTLLEDCSYEDTLHYYNKYLVHAKIEEQSPECIAIMNEIRVEVYNDLYFYVKEMVPNTNTSFEELHLPVHDDFEEEQP